MKIEIKILILKAIPIAKFSKTPSRPTVTNVGHNWTIDMHDVETTLTLRNSLDHPLSFY